MASLPGYLKKKTKQPDKQNDYGQKEQDLGLIPGTDYTVFQSKFQGTSDCCDFQLFLCGYFN